MVRLGCPLFVFLSLCAYALAASSPTETTTTNFQEPAVTNTDSEANFRESALRKFGSNVKRLVVDNLPKRFQSGIKKTVSAIQKELNRRDVSPEEVRGLFDQLLGLLEKATAKRGAHLVTVLRIKQKKTLNRLLRLLQRARSSGDQGKVQNYLSLLDQRRAKSRESFDKEFDQTRQIVYSTLSDIVALVHTLNINLAPDWRRQMEDGGRVVVRKLESARKVLDDEDLNIHNIISKTTVVVTSNPEAPQRGSASGDDDEDEPNGDSSVLSGAQNILERSSRRSARISSRLNSDHTSGLNFAFVPAGVNPRDYLRSQGIDDDIADFQDSQEEDDRRRVRVLEGKRLEWNFDVEEPATQETQAPESDDYTPPDLVGRLWKAKREMDRIAKIHERQMSRRLHELVMAGMVGHSKLIRFVNNFEFSRDEDRRQFGRKLRKIVDLRRARRILHERKLFQLNRERQEDTFLYNRLVLRNIQSLGIHELAVELGQRSWGRKYLQNNVIQNLVRQHKLSALARIQNLFRLKHELRMKKAVDMEEQNRALRRAARAAGIPLSALPRLPLLKPGGGLVLSLKRAARGRSSGRSSSRRSSRRSSSRRSSRRSSSRRSSRRSSSRRSSSRRSSSRRSSSRRSSRRSSSRRSSSRSSDDGYNFQEDDDDNNNDDDNNDDADNNNDDADQDDGNTEEDRLRAEDLEDVVGFLRDARNRQRTLLKQHREYMRALKDRLRSDRSNEMDDLRQITDDDDLIDAFRDNAEAERRRQDNEEDTFEKMIEELRVDLQEQLEDLQQAEERICKLDSFTGRCKKAAKKPCDRYHGYGSYLQQFLARLYKMRTKNNDEKSSLLEKLKTLEESTERSEALARRGVSLDAYRAKQEDDDDEEEKTVTKKKVAKPVKHVYEVYGVNYEEDDDDDDNNNDQTEDSRDEQVQVESINHIIRLLRGLIYFSLDEEKAEKKQMEKVLTRHDKVHRIIISMVDKFHARWERLFSDDNVDEEEDRMEQATDDLIRLFKLSRAFARRSKEDELDIIDQITSRREELTARIEEVEKEYDVWRTYFSEVSSKVSGLLEMVVQKQEAQNQEEAEIMSLLDGRRQEEEQEEEALLNALRSFRTSKFNERKSKRSFKLLIFKKSKK